MTHQNKYTFRFGKYSELTVRVWFDESMNMGGVVSYYDEECFDRAFKDRYDMMDVETLEDFNRRCKFFQRKQ